MKSAGCLIFVIFIITFLNFALCSFLNSWFSEFAIIIFEIAVFIVVVLFIYFAVHFCENWKRRRV